jgi:hypothetical protein
MSFRLSLNKFCFLLGERCYSLLASKRVLGGSDHYTKQKCYYFQLKLIPSNYSVIVLSGLGIEGGV